MDAFQSNPGDAGRRENLRFGLFKRRGKQSDANKDGGRSGRLLLRQVGKKVLDEGNDAFGFLRKAQVPRRLFRFRCSLMTLLGSS